MAWCIMRLVHFAPYINGLWSALVGEYSLSGCLCGVGLYEHLERESVSVFDGFVCL